MADKLFKKGTFEFIGDVITGKELVTTQKMGTSDWEKTRLNFGVKDGLNTQFLTCEYIHNDKIKDTVIYTEDGSKKVAWEDTASPKIINSVPEIFRKVIDTETDFDLKNEYTKLIFKRLAHENKQEQTDEDKSKIAEYTKQIDELAKNRVTFVHMKDVINYMKGTLPLIKDKKVKVTGTIENNYYNGKNVLQYIPNRIELIPSNTEDQLTVNLDLFFNDGSITDAIEDKRMYIEGYVGGKKKKNKSDNIFYPLSVVFDYSKADLTNDMQKELVEYIKEFFKTEEDKVYKLGIVANIINSAKIVEFDESCLSEKQLRSIKLGFNTLDDFRPKGFVYGDKIQEIRIEKPDLKNYPDGAEEIEKDLFYENIVNDDDSDKNISDVKDDDLKEEGKKDEQMSNEEMMRKLFK